MSEHIIKAEFSEVMQKSYIDYAMSVIAARALHNRYKILPWSFSNPRHVSYQKYCLPTVFPPTSEH